MFSNSNISAIGPSKIDSHEHERYKIEKSKTPLGTGGFSEVVVGYDCKQDKYVAIKIFKDTRKNVENYWRNEYRIMRDLRHDNIVQILDFFEMNSKYYIVTELMKGGELFDRIIERKRFSERDAVTVLQQCLSAILYMHCHGVVHRDLKPENILYISKRSDSRLKITDFGVAGKLKEKGETFHTFVGSKYYVAPEILKESPNYGKSVDMWSIGVITYILLVGYPPFDGSKPKDIYAKIRHFEVKYPEHDWKKISDSAKDFVRSLLVKDPNTRITADKALRHKWLVSLQNDSDLQVNEKISLFQVTARWKIAFNVVEVIQRMIDLAPDSSKLTFLN